MMSIRITSHTNDLMGDLAIARSEAVKRNIPVVLCASIDGDSCADGANWNQGWIVFPDIDASGAKNGAAEATLKTHAALKGEPTIGLSCVGAANKRITYRPTGMSSATTAVFTICDSRTTTNAGRTVTINQTGRVVSARGTCPITATCP
jgi:type IV fimbrial biogenesis protein FimT